MTSPGHRWDCILIHYGEVGLKGGNRPRLLRLLADNVKAALQGLEGVGGVQRLSGRFLLELRASAPEVQAEVLKRLGRVMGLSSFSPARRVESDPQAIEIAAGDIVRDLDYDSFRVSTRRAFKDLPFTSRDVDVRVGAYLQKLKPAQVDLTRPELNLHIEIMPAGSFMYLHKHPGPGGLPLGMSGKALALLSGGIDSPVAAYRMLKRGLSLDFIHFHSHPFVSRASQEKAGELARILKAYHPGAVLYLVPFGELQQRIVAGAPEELRVVLYRRLMLRIAAALAERIGAAALVSGESLGQVASQTLPNLRATQAVVDLPVLRPLVGMDKQEIVRQAQALGTYAVSIRPDEDCCSLFIPRHPATAADPARLEQAEAGLDLAGMLQGALEAARAA